MYNESIQFIYAKHVLNIDLTKSRPKIESNSFYGKLLNEVQQGQLSDGSDFQEDSDAPNWATDPDEDWFVNQIAMGLISRKIQW